MTSRNGKIARLPKAVREQLNRRLEDGETARSLVEWLNGLPEVQALVQREFGGHAIREQNLSQWKNGGYQDWLRHQEALELAGMLHEQAEEMEAQAGAEGQIPMNEVLSLWLSARYALATREVAAAEGPEAWKLLRQLCGDVAKLRRVEQQEERLALLGQKLDLEKERVEVQREAVAIERERWESERPPEPIEPPTDDCDWGPEEAGEDYVAFQEWFAARTDEERVAWVRKKRNWKRIRARTDEEERQLNQMAIDRMMGKVVVDD